MKKVMIFATLALEAILLFSCSDDPETSAEVLAQLGSSSGTALSSSSSGVDLPIFGFCVFSTEKVCLTGPVSDCPPGGELSDACPYYSSSSGEEVGSSSSDGELSSGSVEPSSSSSDEVLSSSSAVPSSSSSWPSSSSAAPSCNISSYCSGADLLWGETSISQALGNFQVNKARCFFTTSISKLNADKTILINGRNASNQNDCYGVWELPCISSLPKVDEGYYIYVPTDAWISAFEMTATYPPCSCSGIDPATKFCSDNKAYDKCNGKEYNPATHFCKEGSIIRFCADFVNGTEREHYGKMKEQFCDERDGRRYVYVSIGKQTWMAENLNYDTGTGVFSCYNRQASYCDIYGRLYNWEMAKTICPSGWHLPSQAEWEVMSDYIGGTSTEGEKLKATSRWLNYNDSQGNSVSGNGTDDYGFTALPGGNDDSGGKSYDLGGIGYWWSTSEYSTNNAYYRRMINYYVGAGWGDYHKSGLLSVRCLQD